MNRPPAGSQTSFDIPGSLSARLAGATVAEYAYLTPGGEPLCWPVTPFWYPQRGVLGVATGLAYPTKARHARRRPRVAARFGSGDTEVLLQGDAVVPDDDLQAATDRYIRELRARFLAARLAVNRLSVGLLDFYLPHVWIEVTPVRLVVREEGAGVEVLGAPAPRREEVADGGSPPGEGLPDGPGLRALQRWVRRRGEGVVTLAGPDGYPVVSRTRVAPGGDGSVELEDAPGRGPAALTLHTEGLGGVRLDALMARGWVVASGGGPRFVPRRVVGFLGRPAGERPRFFSIFPLSQLPRARALREAMARELARRGEPPPRLRVPR
jgi:hypothetical protein